MNAKAETQSISMEYDLPHPPLDTVVTWTLTPTPSVGTRLALEHSGFLPDNASAFDGARTGWQRMVGERLREVLAGS